MDLRLFLMNTGWMMVLLIVALGSVPIFALLYYVAQLVVRMLEAPDAEFLQGYGQKASLHITANPLTPEHNQVISTNIHIQSHYA